jgi:hypothetical protein
MDGAPLDKIFLLPQFQRKMKALGVCRIFSDEILDPYAEYGCRMEIEVEFGQRTTSAGGERYDANGNPYAYGDPYAYFDVTHEQRVYFSATMFPGCCGIVVLHDLYTSPSKIDPKVLDLVMAGVLELWKDRVRPPDGPVETWGNVITCATTTHNSDQRRFEGWCRRAGFRKLSASKNPRTRNTVHMWVKTISPSRRKRTNS